MIHRPYLSPSIGILLGFVAGWCLGRPPSGGNAVMEVADSGLPNEYSPAKERLEENKPLRIADGAVWIPKEKLASIAGSTLAARMYLDDSSDSDWPCVNALRSWVPMTDDERTEFKKVLQQAARQRMAWESSNVTVKETGPGEWRVIFPGDGGNAKSELQRAIEKIFGAERAGQIDILGNTDGFFGMKWLAPGFRHGEIRMMAMVEKTLWRKENIRLSVEIDGRAIGLYLDGNSLEEKVFAQRILPRMGGLDVLRRGAETRH